MAINIDYIKFKDDAHEPTRGSAAAAGYDLYSDDKYVILPQETVKVNTSLGMKLPIGTFGAIFARSGLATKQGLRPANCVGK